MLRVHLGVEPSNEKTLFAVLVCSLDDVSAAFEDVRPGFGLLLACDATSMSVEEVSAVASTALHRGVACVCAWGPDCERVHDIIDEEYVGTGGAICECELLTSWHAAESLDHALWYFIDVAMSTHGQATDWLAVSVGNLEWFERLRRRMADVPQLRADVLGTERS